MKDQHVDSVNIIKFRKKICLSLNYIASNNFLYANGIKINQFKAKNSEIKSYSLCLVSISKDFTVDNMKKTGLNGKIYDFTVSCGTIDVSDIKDLHKF